MTERLRSASTTGYHCPKMENDLSPRKTMLVIVIVVGCFAVLWPKVFYPILVGSANQHIKPSSIDKTTGCCDVISETDVHTIKIMSELCGTIIKATEDEPLTGKEIVRRCRQEVLETCGIDISLVLQEQVRLGQNVKQILDEVRSLNGSLCLKYNYGVAPWRLGVPHRITVRTASDTSNIRQERPMHLRSELIHPAFRERGRAIPQPQPAPPTRPPPRVVEGRPGPVPGMRPTIGGAGHVVPPPKQGTSSMSVIMPIYTIGIVIFFTYTLMKILFKKQPESVGGALYPPVEPDPHFRKEVFESEASRLGPRLTRENISSKLVVNAMSALLDEVDQEIEARRKSSEVASQDLVNGTLSNGDAVKPQEEEQPTVKVLGMEMTASCEGGKKWSRPESPVLPTSPPPAAEPAPPPQEIYLEGALPAQSHLLVADSATESQSSIGEDPAVVLSGKMTLSVISLDSENGVEEAANGTVGREPISVEQPLVQLEEEEESVLPADLEKDIQDFLQKLKEQSDFTDQQVEPVVQLEEESLQSAGLEQDIQDFLQRLKEENDFQTPVITLESEDLPQTLEVESLEREVDDLILEAIENVDQRETNEIDELKLTKTEPNLLLETEKSPKLELKEEISNEIEKLIQEVKDMPIVEQKLEAKERTQDNGLDIKTPIEEKATPIEENIGIAEKIEDTEKVQATEEPTQTEEITIIEGSTLQSEEPNSEKESARSTDIVQKVEKIPSSVEEKIKLEEVAQSSNEDALPASKKVEEILSTIEEKIKPEEIAKSLSEDKLPAPTTNVEEKFEIVEVDAEAEDKLQSEPEATPSGNIEENVIIDPIDYDLASDEELVEEIEEIEYEDDSGEEEIEVEVEEDESEEEIPNERNLTRTESSSVQRVNGERSEDLVEESKYTTVSGATAAENDISDEELTDNEDVEEEEELIEVEEIEDDDYINEGNDINHVSGDSEPEL